MAVDLIVEPRKVYSWEEFRNQKPKYSIALDGFVDSPTIRDPYGPYANFDHHSHTDRLSTRSTSEQVQIEINMGLFDTFNENGVPKAIVYVNDADEDTCLAWWLLKYNDLVKKHGSPKINRLVYCEDRLDSTSGAYPLGDISIRRQMAWVFYPYNSARFEGCLGFMDASDMKSVIESVESRINAHIMGKGGEIPLEGNYERIGGGDGWVLTKETGPASRMAMYNDGVKAFITLVASKNDSSYVYTVGRKSVWIPFNMDKLYSLLNKIEGGIINASNHWGGSDIIGGSPRASGSRLSPKVLEGIINDHRLFLR